VINHQQTPEPSALNSAPIQTQITAEWLRQTKLSFNIALIATAIATIIILTGATLLLSGKLSEGSFITISGALSATYCTRFAKECSDRLDRQRHQ
jgi:hypothetical protein